VSAKTCRKCGESKDAGEFPANRRMGDGLSSWCRACHNEASARWREKTRVRRSGSRHAVHCRNCGRFFLTWVDAHEQSFCSRACEAARLQLRVSR
jgi:hypothetical protein